MEEKIRQDWFDACNHKEWEHIESLYTKNALVHGREGHLYGGVAVVGLIKKWFEALPDAKVSLLHISTEKDVVVAHWRVTGTFENAIAGIEPTKEPVNFHGLTCFRFNQDEQVTEHWAAIDYLPLQSAASNCNKE